ncbi:hypothetical protein [Microtetraspora glauca]|uniref:Uncharacterized protein n=1 Tax=Microtetraspora glauca TaxID=1996 RepID=A0ABV3GI31_MICGL
MGPRDTFRPVRLAPDGTCPGTTSAPLTAGPRVVERTARDLPDRHLPRAMVLAVDMFTGR